MLATRAARETPALHSEIILLAPRSFAALEDDAFGVGRKTAAGVNPHPTF